MIKITTLIAALFGAAYGSVADIEILLAIITSIGILFSFYNVRESWIDFIKLRRLGKSDRGRNYDPRMIVANNGLRAEIARSLIQTWLLTLSIIAMTIPETPAFVHEPIKLVIFGFIFRWGIIGTSLLLSLKSLWGYQVRHRVLEHYSGDDDEA